MLTSFIHMFRITFESFFQNDGHIRFCHIIFFVTNRKVKRGEWYISRKSVVLDKPKILKIPTTYKLVNVLTLPKDKGTESPSLL